MTEIAESSDLEILPAIPLINRVAKIEVEGVESFPTVLTGKELPTRRVDLGRRQPIFQPVILFDAKPTWEDESSVNPVAKPSGTRTLVTGLTLVLLTSIVAAVAILPNTRPKEDLLSDPQNFAAAPKHLVSLLDKHLRADTFEQKREGMANTEQMKAYYQDRSLTPPWLPRSSLSDYPSQFDPSSGLLTIHLRDSFPISVTVRDEKLDWPTLVGLGDQTLCQFFKERPDQDTVLRVFANLASPRDRVWHLPKENYAKVHLSDLEGIVKGTAYLPRNELPPLTTERRRVTLQVAYVDSETRGVQVPLITSWIADFW